MLFAITVAFEHLKTILFDFAAAGTPNCPGRKGTTVP